MDLVITMLIPLIIALIASSGFWALLEKRTQRSTGQTKLLIGLAHDRIRWLALLYIERGYITQDEYEDLVNYLFKPYQELGGNGSTLRLMEQITKLPLKPQSVLKEKEL